ncbi:MAG: CmpA/NrtA family ABC transporter substrate-binding protein [Notoacmeibacter sp.]
MSLYPVSAAFMPLTDSAILHAAAAFGFAENEGVHLNLTRETSWANVRDRVAVGHFDVAHMLAPMPIAFNLGLSPLKLKVIAPMALGLGGNAITVSVALANQMQKAHSINALRPKTVGLALKNIIDERNKKRSPKLKLGVVHPHSVHNFELRYWLSACKIDPENDVEIIIVPPPLMPDALASGHIDGFCVGEPWNSVAVHQGHGVMATVKAAIWKLSPEKVMGVSETWANQKPEVLAALLRAMYKAAHWCGDPQNHLELAQLLSKPTNLNQPAHIIMAALAGKFPNPKGTELDVADFFVPFAQAATFPWQSHALWLYTQMVRWGHIEHTAQNAEIAFCSYRPDIYRAALKSLDVELPEINSKTKGPAGTKATAVKSKDRLFSGASGFFDGDVFDPSDIDAYIRHQRAQI